MLMGSGESGNWEFAGTVSKNKAGVTKVVKNLVFMISFLGYHKVNDTEIMPKWL
jgi:hypothetical protein